MDNSSREGNTSPPDLPLEKSYAGQLYIVTCLFTLYAEYIIRNAGLEEAQAGIKIARIINNFRYADDNTLMAESKEELESLLNVIEESEKSWLKTKCSEN